jgi:CubicO group peptidase (beta-lactamase class C family)
MQATSEKRRHTTALLLALPLLGVFRGAQAADAIASAIANAAAGFMADPGAVGLSVGVIRAGAASTHHLGSTGAGNPVPDDRTLYPIASLTKTFTGTLLAQAQVDGKLALDDDVRRYLDGGYPNLAFDGQPIRIHHLVNHVSGLPRLLPDMPEGPGDIPYPQRLRAFVAGSTRARFYAALHRVRLAAPPGTRFSYSNAAAQLAGHILERVYGVPFETLVRTRIAAPLGMPDTCITPTAQQRSRLATGYEGGAPQPAFPDQMQAAGALKSTLADMLAYARWHLAEQDPAVKLAHLPADRAGDYTAGLNWQILRQGGRRVLFQDGTQPGFASMLVLYPDNGMAIVVLSNEIDGGTLGRLRTLVNGIAQALDGAAPAVP